MAWGMIIGAVISGVASHAASKSASGSAKKQQKEEFENQKKLLELQRQYQLEDRKYNQDAVGSWAKFFKPQDGAAPSGMTHPVQNRQAMAPPQFQEYQPQGNGPFFGAFYG